MARNPDWTRDEVILALDLYFRYGRIQLPENHPEVIALSNFLRQLEIIPASLRNENFRSPNGVSMKLGNFLAIDPEYPGVGLSAQSKLDVAVWKEFSDDPTYLSKIAKIILTSVAEGAEITQRDVPQEVVVQDEDEFPEGKILTRIHRSKERNSKVVDKKKENALKITGKLVCEVCDFDFESVYGDIGYGFAECHHIIPLSELQPNTITKTSDLAIVCANCHRMLHKTRPVLTIEQLRQIVVDRRSH